MSTLSQIRDAVKTTLEANISGLLAYDTAPDVTQVPCVIVVPRTGNYVVGMGNCVDWTFNLFVLVSRGPIDLSQDSLDGYINGSGATSVPATIKANSGLGLSDVSAQIIGMSDYGGEYKAAGVDHIGATLELRVIATL